MAINLCRISWPNWDSPLCLKLIWLPHVFAVKISHVAWKQLEYGRGFHVFDTSLFSISLQGGLVIGADGLLVHTCMVRAGGTIHQALVNLPPWTSEYSLSSEAFFQPVFLRFSMRLGEDKTKIITKSCWHFCGQKFKLPSMLREGFILGLVSSFRKKWVPPSWI